MRNALLFAVICGIAAGAVLICGSFHGPLKSPGPASKHWGGQELVTNSTNGIVGADCFNKNDRRLATMQQQADLVFESTDWQTLKLLGSKSGKPAKRTFPIFSLEKGFISATSHKSLPLVVVIVPEESPVASDGDGPESDRIMTQLDAALRNEGVKRVVFQSVSFGHWFELVEKR